MLQALFKNKLSKSFESPFKHSEDSLTSSIFGLLQYLSSKDIWLFLTQSCNNNSPKEEVGDFLGIQFWPKWRLENSYVEPDIFIEFEKINIIIEAKKYDDISQQVGGQWQKQIEAYQNQNEIEIEKNLILIALGGNKSLNTKNIEVNMIDYKIYLASWQNLLNAIVKEKASLKKEEKTMAKKRLLSDIILAFEKHNYFSINWLNTLPNNKLNINSITTIASWKTNH